MGRRSSGEKLVWALLFELPFYAGYLALLSLKLLVKVLAWVFSLISECVSLSSRWHEKRSQEAQLRLLTMEGLDDMTGSQFEQYLVGLLRHHEYSVEHVGRAGDQGCDLLLLNENRKYVCQAKCYKGFVTNSAIQEAVAAKAYYRASECMVVTNSYFTKSARALASANGCHLIDRDELARMIRQYREN